MKPFLLLSAVLFAIPLLHADTLSVFPIGDECIVGPYEMYTGYAEGFVCGFGGSSYTQSGSIVTVTSGLLAPDPWSDTTGTWTFDLSHLYLGADYAEAFAIAPVTYQLNPDPPYAYSTFDLHATLFVAGVPLDPPAAVPEPASFALVAAPLLLLLRFRKRLC